MVTFCLAPNILREPRQTRARRECYLSVLARDGKSLPVPLGVFCSEGPAVSRTQMRIAWTEWTDPKPGEGNLASSKMYLADLVYTEGKPAIANRRLLLDGSELGFRCTMETQNFRPHHEDELTFSTYTDGGRKSFDVFSVNLLTKKLTRYTDTPAIYDEVEGAFSDGEYTIEECDEQRPGGQEYDLSLEAATRRQRQAHPPDALQ